MKGRSFEGLYEWGIDPHPTCLYLAPLQTAAENMRELSPAVQRKVLGENGTKLYRL